MNDTSEPLTTDAPADPPEAEKTDVCESCRLPVSDRQRHDLYECIHKCEECARDNLSGTNGMKIHLARFCSKTVLGDGPPEPPAEAEAPDVVEQAAVEQPAAILTPAEAPAPSYRIISPSPAAMPESVRDPQSRIANNTHTWYGFVPEVDITGISTTGLPDDILHSAPAWQPHEVASQIDQGHILLTAVERYGGIVRGTPYVHIQPPSRATLDPFIEQWRAMLPYELDIERDLLEQAETDLARAMTRDDRALARQRVRIFSTRVQQMEQFDFDRIYQFLLREHEFSRAVGRSNTQIAEETIDARIEEKLIEREMEAHVG